MIRRTGAVLFVAFLLVTLFLYRREEKRRLAEYRGLLRLISHIRDTLAVSRARSPRSMPPSRTGRWNGQGFFPF